MIRKKKRAIEKVVVLPDIHAPRHHQESINLVCEFIRDYKPDGIIQLGDLCDFNSIARFDTIQTSDLISIDKEIASANKVLDQIDEAAQESVKWKVMCEGNHDHRPETFRLNRWTKQVQDVLGRERLDNWSTLYRLAQRGWEAVPYGKCYKHGKALFTHGWYIGRHHAAKTVGTWFKTIIYGHTHESQEHTINGMDGNPVSGISLGTLSRFDLSYLMGVPPKWTRMFAYMDFFADGLFSFHPVKIIKNKFVEMGKLYGN